MWGVCVCVRRWCVTKLSDNVAVAMFAGFEGENLLATSCSMQK